MTGLRGSARLALRLGAETADLHAAAERAGFIARLLAGRASRSDYCRLLRNLHAIYAALESALALHRAHPGVAPVCLPELARAAAIAADLSLLHGRGWMREIARRAAPRGSIERARRINTRSGRLRSACPTIVGNGKAAATAARRKALVSPNRKAHRISVIRLLAPA